MVTRVEAAAGGTWEKVARLATNAELHYGHRARERETERRQPLGMEARGQRRARGGNQREGTKGVRGMTIGCDPKLRHAGRGGPHAPSGFLVRVRWQ